MPTAQMASGSMIPVVHDRPWRTRSAWQSLISRSNRMRDAGARYKVAKNRLALIALEGTRYAPISEMLTGPTALATSADPVAAAKVAVDFAKTTDRFEIVGGAMGDTLLDVAVVKALAELPSLDELRAKIIGLIQAPASKIARTINEPGAMLARVIGAFAAKENA